MKGLITFFLLISVSLQAQKSTIIIKSSVEKFKILVDKYPQSTSAYGTYFVYTGQFPKDKFIELDILKYAQKIIIPFNKITKNKTFFELKKSKNDSLYIIEVSPFVSNDVPFYAVYRTKPASVVLDSSKMAKSCKMSDKEVTVFGSNFNLLKTEKSKTNYIKSYLSEKCITIDQAKVMLAPIESDEDKFMASKLFFEHCTHADYYDNLRVVFKSKEAADKFSNWLKTKK
jgi:hypothetical protein